MASDDAQLSLGDGSGTAVLSGIVNFLQDGGTASRVILSSVLGLVVAPFIAIADVISAVTAFFTTPFEEVALSISELAGAFFQEPAGAIATGFEVTASTLTTFFGGSFIGILAGPVGVAMVLLSLFLVVQYLQEDETGDTIPGLPFDTPDFGPFEFGVTEEDEEVDPDAQ